MSRRANYEISYENADHMLIVDLGPWDEHLTVTNDAEAVVEELAEKLHGRRLYYRDSNGQMDEILVKNGEFAGFAPGPSSEQP